MIKIFHKNFNMNYINDKVRFIFLYFFKMSNKNFDDICIHWFRRDLRISDNPAFNLALLHKKIVLVYIIDNLTHSNLGQNSKHWLYHSLRSLNMSLFGNLSLYKGTSIDVLSMIVKSFGIKAIYWNKCYEPNYIRQDYKIKNYFLSRNISVKITNGSLLWNPQDIKNNNGEPYKIFSYFYKKAILQNKPRKPLNCFNKINSYCKDKNFSLNMNQIKLILNVKSNEKFLLKWLIGEQGALFNFKKFIKTKLKNYSKARNVPSKNNVSKLSAHLHFGEISPNQLYYKINSSFLHYNDDIKCFFNQIMWREFSYNQLYYNPCLPIKNLRKKFNYFPWKFNNDYLEKWKQGKTGFPIIDAGMRELLQTGYMHNRLRMIVGSFLVKNLLIHWKYGAEWFLNKLVDADCASNSANWQWIAGSGLDYMPYFRIFNPILQAKKFDPHGIYIRNFIPEIKLLPNKYIFSPWNTPKIVLDKYDITIGTTYPYPIIDLSKSAEKSLFLFKQLKDIKN